MPILPGKSKIAKRLLWVYTAWYKSVTLFGPFTKSNEVTAVKIEKLNDFQIRCTLTAEDLKQNQLGLTDIACCSDKAKSLLKDMIKHASDDFGFELTNTSSLMVELRATSLDNVILTITRISGPDDMRRYMAGSAFASLGFTEDAFQQTDTNKDGASAYMEKYKSLFEAALSGNGTPEEENAEGMRSFRFDSLDDVIAAARAVGRGFSGVNSLYRFGNGNNFQLLIHSEEGNAEECARVCNAISEYGLALNCTPATENYLREHGGLILANTAIQQLAEF